MQKIIYFYSSSESDDETRSLRVLTSYNSILSVSTEPLSVETARPHAAPEGHRSVHQSVFV